MQQEKKFYLGDGENKVLLVFNLNVMAEIQGKYTSVTKWSELMDDADGERNGEPDMTAFLTGFSFMLNEGVDIENDTRKPEEQKQPYTVKQVGRLVAQWGQAEVADAMRNAVTSSTDTGEDTKNVSSETKTTTA